MFFFVYCISICCDKGQSFPENYQFKQLIISYDFIEYETEGVHNFENVPVGAADLNFQRDIQIVRQQSMRQMSSQRQSLRPAGFGERMRKTIVQRFNFNSVNFGFCPICTLDFVTGDRIYQLGCHDTHVLHESCFDDYAKFSKDKGKSLLCPVCRIPVDESKLQKSELQIAGAKKTGDEAMFDDHQPVGAATELVSMPPQPIAEGDGVVIDAPIEEAAPGDEDVPDDDAAAGDMPEV